MFVRAASLSALFLFLPAAAQAQSFQPITKAAAITLIQQTAPASWQAQHDEALARRDEARTWVIRGGILTGLGVVLAVVGRACAGPNETYCGTNLAGKFGYLVAIGGGALTFYESHELSKAKADLARLDAQKNSTQPIKLAISYSVRW